MIIDKLGAINSLEQWVLFKRCLVDCGDIVGVARLFGFIKLCVVRSGNRGVQFALVSTLAHVGSVGHSLLTYNDLLTGVDLGHDVLFDGALDISSIVIVQRGH